MGAYGAGRRSWAKALPQAVQSPPHAGLTFSDQQRLELHPGLCWEPVQFAKSPGRSERSLTMLLLLLRSAD